MTAERTYRHGTDLTFTFDQSNAVSKDAEEATRPTVEWMVAYGSHRCALAPIASGLRFYVDSAEGAAAFKKSFGGRVWYIPDTLSEEQMRSPKSRDEARTYEDDGADGNIG